MLTVYADYIFDLSLVRGKGYYAGTVFEIQSNEFGGSIGGGGRYDNLIGRFTNENVPAVGLSIGSERVSSILTERGFKVPNQKEEVALIYDEQDITVAIKISNFLRTQYNIILTNNTKKLGKLYNKLSSQGFSNITLLSDGI